MSKKSKSEKILEKSIQAVLSAIELYNKPNFTYREESFCILMTNAWELLLKAKILKDNKNNLKALYVEVPSKTRANQPRKRPKYKTTRSGNYMTRGLSEMLDQIIDDKNLKNNLESLIELREISIHFYNTNPLFQQEVLDIGTASLQNYQLILEEWFERDLDKYNLFLMPLAFDIPKVFDLNLYKDEGSEIKKIFNFIETNKKQSDIDSKFSVTLKVDIKINRKNEGIAMTFNESGFPIYQDTEEAFRNKYPIKFKDLKTKLKERYDNFVMNKRFWAILREVKKDCRFYGERYLDYKNPKGVKMGYYSSEIFKELDKHYKRKSK